ncbi:MAG: cytidine deaminase [Pleurocapsa minor GSE-CHR-MK-17-07R]|jgi:cytidine deaminase|nr:cytidine deaminase [Pleurocapsa minor GSE-CHR-MK 17-07R]
MSKSSGSTAGFDEDLGALIQAAIAVAQHAYIPYSHYPVGAALVATDGRVFTGCNVENASYPAGICAERSALVKAISEGAREFTQIVVATSNGGSPCGVCRQMMYEFAPHLDVIMVDMQGTVQHRMRLADLLPLGFNRDSLEAPPPA